MNFGEKFYSRRLKRIVHPGEDIYLQELKHKLEEEIKFYRTAGCGSAGCNPQELNIRNELNRLNNLLNS